MSDQDGIIELLMAPPLMEALAAAEHVRWSHWQRYMHAQCVVGEDGSLIIPADLVRQWTRQMDASYEELSEKEKASDREQVHRYLPIIAAVLSPDVL